MLHLGIDIGTTKVSAAIAAEDMSFHAAAAADHHAAVTREKGFFEQDFGKIENAVRKVLDALPQDALGSVVSVGISTQMHTVLLGRSDGTVSNCVTWQDRRAEPILADLRRASGRNLFPGYGAITLAWYARRGELDRWDWAATPGDELARRLTGASRAEAMDPSLAAAWGIYDSVRHDWDSRAAKVLDIPARFLPRIATCGTVAGLTTGHFGGIPDGIPVLPAIGDNQASVIGSGGNPDTDLFATVGTGSQLSAVMPEDEARLIPPAPGLDFRPFPGGRTLVAVPPLSGGKAWSLLADAVSGLLAAFGAAPQGCNLLDFLSDLADKAPSDADGLRIVPDFFGTRVHPGEFGSITGITATNFTLQNVARAMANGIVENLFAPMPASVIRSRKRIIGSGNGLAKCGAVRHALQERCDLPLVMPQVREEAATGAALFAGSAICRLR
jgi:sedoheptulokinase